MAAVVVYPFKKLRAVLAPRHVAAIAGEPGAIETKAPIVAKLEPNKVELTKCRPGRICGLDDIRPANFRNATREPVKVTPPAMVRTLGNSASIKLLTYENSKISRDHVQRGNVSYIGEHASDAREDSRQPNHRM
jgi:hypothetical protein